MPSKVRALRLGRRWTECCFGPGGEARRLAGSARDSPQIRESGTLKLRGWRGHFRTVSVQCPWGSWHVRWGLVAGLAFVEV